MLHVGPVAGALWGFAIVALWFLFRKLEQLRGSFRTDWQRRADL
jgi:hypothetical protein